MREAAKRGEMNEPTIIYIPEGKQFNGEEVVYRVVQCLEAIQEHRQDDELRYSASDCYWNIRRIFQYINKQIRGEFTIHRLKKGRYRFAFNRKPAAERKADRKHKAEIEATRKMIERLKF